MRKRTTKAFRGRFVIVTLLDHTGYDGYYTRQELNKVRAKRLKVPGWIVDETGKEIKLAQALSETEVFGRIFVVLRADIENILEIDLHSILGSGRGVDEKAKQKG